ncbi:SDR family NAD(P)-dependent oxidoreductase [Oceanibium sediminis]|uniref:SDR family NAD(P)-dependent oxidoreductase n=1 Tax=Oceanibium sediminis TaxID=2026339 RepID=UPI000DD4DFE7|nr:SDR family NAD(P)-dependent oxidoreductase [Oceanibium sediminis]
MELNGHVALITGAGSGLGAATARHLAACGATIIALDFDATRAKATAEATGGHAVVADVADTGAVEQALREGIAAAGQAPRIVVNCAGIAPAARVVGREGKLSTDLFRQVIGVNLIGTYNVMSAATREMLVLDPLEDGERGVVINTASIAYEDGQFGQTAYAASKGGVAAMSLPAAREFAKSGIRVIAIAPGLFHTPMMESLPEETTAAITANIPFPARLGDPEEYAALVEHIVRNRFLNATTIRLDGATRLPPR